MPRAMPYWHGWLGVGARLGRAPGHPRALGFSIFFFFVFSLVNDGCTEALSVCQFKEKKNKIGAWYFPYLPRAYLWVPQEGREEEGEKKKEEAGLELGREGWKERSGREEEKMEVDLVAMGWSRGS